MRPIVKAVGLISILAHDYLIVKIKVLFRDSVVVVDHKLSVDAGSSPDGGQSIFS